MEDFIFLDNHSTTKVDENVLESMLPYFSKNYGNPSSRDNFFGRFAFQAVETSREKIAKLINSNSEEIIFTSCATESNNLVLKGICESYYKKGKHIVTVSTEHNSILQVCKKLEKFGFEVTVLEVDSKGNFSIDDFKNSLRNDTILVTVMMANNEIGTIHEIEKISKICFDKNIPFHTDASQCGAYLEINIKKINPTFLTLSSHKMHGPKGISALFINKNHDFKLTPQIDGGAQESGIRSGSLNVPSIVGFGKAAEISMLEKNIYVQKVYKLKNDLKDFFLSFEDVKLNGNLENSLPNNLNVTINGIKNTDLIKNSGKIIFSANSACLNSDGENYSHVLKAIGLNKSEANSTVRIGLSKFTTEDEIEQTKNILKSVINNLKKQNYITV